MGESTDDPRRDRAEGGERGSRRRRLEIKPERFRENLERFYGRLREDERAQ
jgi:hypothetical protein